MDISFIQSFKTSLIMSHGAPKESSVSLESGYSSNSDLRLRANSQLDNQKHRSNEAVVDQEGALTSGSSHVENHPEEKYAVQRQSLPVSPHLGGRGTSRDFTPHLVSVLYILWWNSSIRTP